MKAARCSALAWATTGAAPYWCSNVRFLQLSFHAHSPERRGLRPSPTLTRLWPKCDHDGGPLLSEQLWRCAVAPPQRAERKYLSRGASVESTMSVSFITAFYVSSVLSASASPVSACGRRRENSAARMPPAARRSDGRRSDADDLWLEGRMLFVHVLDQLEFRFGRPTIRISSAPSSARTTSR